MLYRGLKNVALPDAFLREGGTELGMMSATLDANVAVRRRGGGISPNAVAAAVLHVRGTRAGPRRAVLRTVGAAAPFAGGACCAYTGCRTSACCAYG